MVEKGSIIWKFTGWKVTSMMAHSYSIGQKPQFLSGSWWDVSVSHDVDLSIGLLERHVGSAHVMEVSFPQSEREWERRERRIEEPKYLL